MYHILFTVWLYAIMIIALLQRETSRYSLFLLSWAPALLILQSDCLALFITLSPSQMRPVPWAYSPQGWQSEYVNPYIPTQNPRGRLKWPYTITRLTAHFMCGLMSNLVICKFRKSMVIHDTECPYWDQVSLNNTNQTLGPMRLKGSHGSNQPICLVCLMSTAWKCSALELQDV